MANPFVRIWDRFTVEDLSELPSGSDRVLATDDRAQPSPQQVKHYKRFAGADNNNLLYGWTNQPYHIDQFIRKNLRTLVARCRQQARDNDYARRFISMCESNIVGENGITIQAQVKQPGNPDRLDDMANDALEAHFQSWGEDHADVCGVTDWVDMQRLGVRGMPSDGEMIFIEHIGPGFGPYGYQLESVDPQLLDVTLTMDRGGRKIRNGIEYDERGRPLFYYFNELDVWGQYQHGAHRKVAADIVIHLFLPEWVGQNRGIPWMASALFRMKMLGGYEEAAMVAARVGASKMGFIKAPDPDSYVGDDKDERGNKISEATPGHIEWLPEDSEFINYDPSYPHEQFSEFMSRALRGMAAGLGGGVPYEALANDRGDVNYSSGRLGELDVRGVWKSAQRFMIAKLARRVRNRWLDIAMLSGRITVKGRPLSRSVEEYRPAMYQGPRWEWVDPQKEMTANEKAIGHNISSVSAIIRAKGGDPDEVFREIAAEQKKWKELGIEPVKKSPGAVAPKDDDEVDEDEEQEQAAKDS